MARMRIPLQVCHSSTHRYYTILYRSMPHYTRGYDFCSRTLLVCLFRCTAFPLTSLYSTVLVPSHTHSPLSHYPIQSARWKRWPAGCFIVAVGATRLCKSWGGKNKKKDKLQPSGLRRPTAALSLV